MTDFGFHPAWSPDGQQLVFCTEQIDDPASRGAESSLWVVDAAGGEPRRILETDAVQPAWSPGGHRIAFWPAHNGQRDLYTVPAEGGAATASPRMLHSTGDRRGRRMARTSISPATGAAP